MWKPYNLFVDLAPPYWDRVSCLKAMEHNNPDKAHGLVRHGLSVTFDRLHTKESLLFYSKLLIPLYNDEPAPQGEKELAQNIINRLLGTEGSDMDRMVHDAWAIANELLTSLQWDEEKLWRVVQGVWVEMLCFSAGRCRGYLHAKSLGKGGEFLSYVWLLLFYMGMETVAEKTQRSELQEETDEGGPVVDPR